jgi:hypothetical protein
LKNIDMLDPDWWLSRGWNLLDYRFLSEEQKADPKIIAAFADRPEPAAHLGRWLSRIGDSGSPEKRIGDKLTEQDLRLAWEGTRSQP